MTELVTDELLRQAEATYKAAGCSFYMGHKVDEENVLVFDTISIIRYDNSGDVELTQEVRNWQGHSAEVINRLLTEAEPVRTYDRLRGVKRFTDADAEDPEGVDHGTNN